MECRHGVNPYPKIKVILCELILMFFIRKDWIDAVSKAPPSPHILPFGDVRESNPDLYLTVNLFPGEACSKTPTPRLDEVSNCCDQAYNKRSLLSTKSWTERRSGKMKHRLSAERESDSASLMMISKHAGRGNAGRGNDRKDEKKKEDRPRRQKQPNGNCIRRRPPLRRRTVRQRLAEKQVLYPNRSHNYRQQAALDREVRGIFARRPEDEHGIGLSSPELRHLETMLRGDGGWGLAVVVASMLQTIATIASDMATMIQIVSMDMDRGHDMDEIAPMPPGGETGAGNAGEEPMGDAEHGDDDYLGSCASASSGRPPRRRRVPQQRVPKAAPKSRPSRDRPADLAKPKAKPNEGAKVDAKNKLAKSIAVAPWRTKIARQKWLIKKNHGHHATRCTPRSRTARPSTWREEEDEEEVIDCDGGPGNQGRNPAEHEEDLVDDIPEGHGEEPSAREADDSVEVEVEDDGKGEDGGEEEYDYDDMQLMQQDHQVNGKQLGTLSADQMAEFVEAFKKNYVTMLHPMVEKPVKLALLRGTRSRLPGVRRISKVLMAQIQTLKLAESKSGLPPWWKPFWSRVRNAIKRAGRVPYAISTKDPCLR